MNLLSLIRLCRPAIYWLFLCKVVHGAFSLKLFRESFKLPFIELLALRHWAAACGMLQ